MEKLSASWNVWRKEFKECFLILYENGLILWWNYYLCTLYPLEETRNMRISWRWLCLCHQFERKVFRKGWTLSNVLIILTPPT